VALGPGRFTGLYDHGCELLRFSLELWQQSESEKYSTRTSVQSDFKQVDQTVVYNPGGVGIEGCERCEDKINGVPSEEV
jgi:hypothetical protein